MTLPICSIESCDNPGYCRGWCSTHYYRWRNHGDPLAGRIRNKKRAACSIAECDRPSKSHGWCDPHYRRWQRHGDPLAGRASPERFPQDICSIEGCDKPHFGRGWCSAHYTRQRRHGDPLAGGANRDPDRRCKNHPDRRGAEGHSLCASCYHRYRMQRTTRRCINHQDVPAYAGGLCNSCYQFSARIRNKYGLTVEQYWQHLAQPCGICGGTADVLDHDHATNRVRGSLCTRCNVNLGTIEMWYIPYREQILAWIDPITLSRRPRLQIPASR